MQTAFQAVETHPEILRLLKSDAQYSLGKREIDMAIFNTPTTNCTPFVFDVYLSSSYTRTTTPAAPGPILLVYITIRYKGWINIERCKSVQLSGSRALMPSKPFLILSPGDSFEHWVLPRAQSIKLQQWCSILERNQELQRVICDSNAWLFRSV